MTTPVLSKVYMSGVAAMCLPYRPAKPIFRVWDHNEMNMVWHQTVGPDCNSTPATPFSHKLYVYLIIIIAEKSLLSSVASLRYMMWVSGYHHLCHSCHNTLPRFCCFLVTQKPVWLRISDLKRFVSIQPTSRINKRLFGWKQPVHYSITLPAIYYLQKYSRITFCNQQYFFCLWKFPES